MQTKCRAIQWIVIGIAIGILAVVAFTNSGCQTTRGVAADFGRLCRDVQQQIPPRDSD